jgi:long-chain acyl-CoA synthetase
MKGNIFTPQFSSIAALLEHHAASFSNKEAIVAVHIDENEEQTLSYSQLAELVYQTANYLFRKGIQRGDRIAFSLENTLEILVLELAAGLLSASSVPLDMKRDTEERKRFKIEGASVKMVFDNTSELTELVREQPTTPSFTPNNSCEEEYVLLYTSGTTANPKGVPLSLKTFFANAEGIAKWQELSSDDRFLIVLPLHHINSTTMSLATLLAGGTVILSSRYSASKFWQTASRHHVTITSIVPTILHDLLTRKKEYFAKQYPLSFKRMLIGSAPVLPEETLRFIETFKIDVIQGYGQTETALRVTGVPINLPQNQYLDLVKRNSIGKELANSHVAILREDGSEAAEKEEGEICIRGPVLADGYLNDEKETEKAFSSGWFHSGDLGYYEIVEGEQYFFIQGRIKEIIIKGGVNISPAAVEDALLKNFPQIQEVAVVGYADERMGEEVAAVIVSQDDLSERIVQQGQLGNIEGLSKYEAPSRVIMAKEELPKTSTGKIQRVLVKEMIPQEKQVHFYTRLIAAEENTVLARALEINNKRWDVPSDIAEFEQRAKNGYSIGAFDSEGEVQGTLSALQVSSEDLEKVATWDEVTGRGTLNTHDSNGEVMLCIAITVNDTSVAGTVPATEVSQEAADAAIEEYLKTDLDNVIRFHRKPKGGMAKGAEVIKILPQGRPQDKDAMGYNVLVEYPALPKNITRSKNASPAVLLIEHAMMLAKEKGCKRVVAFSRPAQFRLHLAKALDPSTDFEPKNKVEFREFVSAWGGT